MDALPVELLTPICFLACTDGGPTACSLSLVSRHIHAVSRPARFHSVAFSGPRVLTAVPNFLARLKEEHEDRKRAEAASRVRHLFVSVLPPLSESQTMVWKVYVFTVTTLLRAVAPDVETLSLVFSPRESGPIKPIELDVQFPGLQELTVSGASFSAPQLGSPAFPAVRRLHLLSGPCPREWTSLTPSVTHLRLSELPDLVVNPDISFKDLQIFTCECRAMISSLRHDPSIAHTRLNVQLQHRSPSGCRRRRRRYRTSRRIIPICSRSLSSPPVFRASGAGASIRISFAGSGSHSPPPGCRCTSYHRTRA